MIRLSESQIRPAGEVAARAFHNDPVTVHLFPNNSGLFDIAPLYEFDIRYCRLYGETYATSPDLEGIAAWLPPGETDMPWHKILRAGALSLLFKVKPSILMRLPQLFTASVDIRKRHISFPHWYLSLLCVAPEHQKKGYGSALLSHMLTRIDSEHLPCYLETTEGKNVSFYERHGFRVLETGKIPDTPLMFWTMLRDRQKCTVILNYRNR
jgi:ribosomal protein S18 acetylase RimI-like enzyme